MDTATYHPLPDIFLSDYQSFSGREYLDILLFRIVPVNPHLRASSDPHPSNRSFQARSLFLQGWGLIDLPLRTSNEDLLRLRVASTEDHQAPSPPLLQKSAKGSGQGCPLLRAWSVNNYKWSFRACSFAFPGMAPVLVPLRPSSEALPRA